MTVAPGEHPRIAVIGLGNVLLSDDGFGPFVIERLRAGWEFPVGVELIDAGTPGLGLVTYLCDREMVILVDAVTATGAPGELRLYRGEELRKVPPKPRVSPHDPAVQETLAMAEFTGHGPRAVLLVGALADATAVGLELSAPMRAAAAAAAEMVIGELRKTGITIVARTAPESAAPWWLRVPGPPSSAATG